MEFPNPMPAQLSPEDRGLLDIVARYLWAQLYDGFVLRGDAQVAVIAYLRSRERSGVSLVNLLPPQDERVG